MNKLSLIIALGTMHLLISPNAHAHTLITETIEAPESQPYCREYTQTIKIGDSLQKAYSTACMQPDGSWELMPSATQAGKPVPNITYIMRDDRMYYMPPQPFVVIGGHFHGGHGYHHGYRR